MSDTTFEVRVPSALLQYGINQREVQQRLKEWLVISLFTDGRASSGKAAQLLGISRIGFLDLLRSRGVAYVNYSPEEIAEELAAAKAVQSF